MATLDERLKDDDYRHWVKAVLCLQYTKDGLISFASKKSQGLHNVVLDQMRRSGNIECNAFLVEAQKYCSRTLNLKNVDKTDLHNQPWQLAKLFMNPGQDVTNTIPGQTDLSGILNFLDHCTLAKAAIQNTANIIAVRVTRKRIMHTADMKITKQDFTTNIIPTLIALLQDPWFLSTDPVAQAAVVKINEVAAADFHITKENEGKVLKDLVTEFQCLNKDLNTKIDDLRKELKRIETNVGQEMKTPEDKLEQEMKTQGDKLEQEMKDKEEDKKMVAAADFHITRENEEKVQNDLTTENQWVKKNFKTTIDDLQKVLQKLKRKETYVGQEMKTQVDKLEQEMKTLRDKLEQEMKAREEDKEMKKDEEEQAGMGEDACVDEEKIPDPDVEEIVEEIVTEGPMTQQHINYACLCNVLHTVCADGLRDILMSKVPPGYANFYAALLANKPMLTAMRQIRQKQIDLLFPDPQGRFTGTVDQFDIALLYTLIRNISPVPAPPTGWDKPPVDQPRDKTLGASVERIHVVRNCVIGHSADGQLEDQVFEDYWNEISAIMDDIENSIGSKGYRIALDERKNQVFTIKQAQTLKLKVKELEEEKKNKDEMLKMIQAILEENK